MHFHHLIAVCLAFASCQSVAARVVHRQDAAVSQQSQMATTSTVAPAKTSTVYTASDVTNSIRATSTGDVASQASTSLPSTVQLSAASSRPSNATKSNDLLPIRPTVTPAMGLTGALLLVTGLIFTIIGIKNKWVYVFGSVAYLTALAVTVLIVYLMSPPVSNAVQGAFFVAAFFTGAIFGALALVFADITEGFGCLLGGFCLSMWFLSLKDGGLISSTTGRAIFIGAFSAGGFCLSFSRLTREFGLIASIAFSGATATILGIDCLARAGWKEFWLYLWSLNDDIFPLNTNTYPVTKNIKAELAGVIIIAVFGVVSQLRFWTLVKGHRAKSAAQALEKQQMQDREEEACGRKIEDNFQRERVQWEAAHGNKSSKSIPGSSLRSSWTLPKDSASIREKEMSVTDSVEKLSLANGSIAPATAGVKGEAVRKGGITQNNGPGNPIYSNYALSTIESHGTPKSSTSTPDRSAVPPPPPIVPLPFTIPTENDGGSDSNDGSSISAIPETGEDELSGSRPMSKRVSDMSASKPVSDHRSSKAGTSLKGVPYEESPMEDDRASSIAATLDDDHEDLSPQQLDDPTLPATVGTNSGDAHNESREVSEARMNDSPGGTQTPSSDTKGEDKEQNAVVGDTSRHDQKKQQDGATTADSEVPAQLSGWPSLTTSTNPKQDESKGGQGSAPHSSESASHSGNAESQVGSLKDGVLPARLSKVALSYRTNEWAKHLEAAEKPSLDDLSRPASPGVVLEERPAPVSEELVSSLVGEKKSPKRVSSAGMMQRNSGVTLHRSTSTTSQLALDQVPSRQTSPATQQELFSRSTPSVDVLSPLPPNTLMSQREQLLKRRISSQNSTPNSSATNLVDKIDEEDMSLAQRRSLLQQQNSTQGLQRQTSSSSTLNLHHANSSASHRKAPPSSSTKWQNKGIAVKGAPPGFDSHQPRRTSSAQSDQKREELYAGWRDTMTSPAPAQQSAAMVAEQQRIALLNDKKRLEAEKQQRAAVAAQRASMMDSMMRSGHMLDAHRDAMRKLQANANKRA